MIALLFLTCFFLLWSAFKENNSKDNKGIMLRQSIINLMHIFKITEIRIPFIVMSLFYVGWFLFISFLSAYLLERFSLDKAQVGKMFAFLAIWFFTGGLITSQWLLKKFSAEITIIIPFFLFACSPIVSVYFNHPNDFWWLLPFAGGCQAIVSSCLYTVFAKIAKPENRGKIFGSINAMMALSLVITPPVSALLGDQWLGLPGLVSGVILFVAIIFYLFWYQRLHRLC